MTDLIRGNQYFLSWYSCDFRVAGVPYIGFQSLSIGDKIDAAYVKGALKTGEPLGTTSGAYEPAPLAIALLTDSAVRLNQQLALLGLGSIGAAEFPLTAIAKELPSVHTIMANRCRVVEMKNEFAISTEGSLTAYVLMPLSITRDGLSLWDRKRNA